MQRSRQCIQAHPPRCPREAPRQRHLDRIGEAEQLFAPQEPARAAPGTALQAVRIQLSATPRRRSAASSHPAGSGRSKAAQVQAPGKGCFGTGSVPIGSRPGQSGRRSSPAGPDLIADAGRSGDFKEIRHGAARRCRQRPRAEGPEALKSGTRTNLKLTAGIFITDRVRSDRDNPRTECRPRPVNAF